MWANKFYVKIKILRRKKYNFDLGPGSIYLKINKILGPNPKKMADR